MAFYLGKDVSVYISTENTTLGVSPVTTTAGAGSVTNAASQTFTGCME